jgi:hypothetical protein
MVCLFQRSNKHPALAPAYRFANGCHSADLLTVQKSANFALLRINQRSRFYKSSHAYLISQAPSLLANRDDGILQTTFLCSTLLR